MARYIAFLRGINVGGHQVKMGELRRAFEDLGLGNVATFIASGNVIFEDDGEPADLVPRIEGHLREGLGYEVPTFLRTDADVARIAAYEPFAGVQPGDGDTSYVGFLGRRPPAATARAVAALSNDTDLVELRDRELYWRIRSGGMQASTLAPTAFESVLGAPTTVRNVNTVRRLAAKYPPLRSP
jgi:uncharacterized protein (DUF1697 family)